MKWVKWHGRLNVRKIFERTLAGTIAGIAAGSAFYALTAVFG